MTEIRFYHLTRKTLEQALPELLEKKWSSIVTDITLRSRLALAVEGFF